MNTRDLWGDGNVLKLDGSNGRTPLYILTKNLILKIGELLSM